mmetsp:Transcript_6114/g.24771  ORF Transcript_6114/g.24771 Transcript_6114/m.24771 type:complete len:220 (-) Transcript_6114:328-987(-)
MFRHRRHWCTFSWQCAQTPCLSATGRVHRGHRGVSRARASAWTWNASRRSATAHTPATGVGNKISASRASGSISPTATRVQRRFCSELGLVTSKARGSSALSLATSARAEVSATNTLKRRTRAARLPRSWLAERVERVRELRDVGARSFAATAQCVCHKSDLSVSRRCVANAPREAEVSEISWLFLSRDERSVNEPPPHAAGLGSVSRMNAETSTSDEF